MSNQKKEPKGCGCSNIPISLILIILGGGYLWFSQPGNLDISKFLPKNEQITNSTSTSTPTNSPIPTPTNSPIPTPTNSPTSAPTNSPTSTPSVNPKTTQKTATSTKQSVIPNTWEKKIIRGIYLSRYQVTNNASEATIRERVRYYKSQGFNTIIHGVWGNGCTMYKSEVLEKMVGLKSCPNQFQDKWLDWLIDEAHKQGMEVHAYFEKGIKIDENSPIFDLAVSRRWIVPGVDKTYPAIDHYVLDVEIPEVANLFTNISVEFVQKYPKIDAVQWDDYLGYHAKLPGKLDRTTKLTNFVQQMITAIKKANPSVSFDICHHNPYWAKQYFAADWEKWNVDRVFIQNYNEANFQEELNYVKNSDGIAISDKQFPRLKELIDNPAVKSILVFPIAGKPEETSVKLKSLIQNKN